MNQGFVIYGNGKTKHLPAPVHHGKRGGSACNMFYDATQFREAIEEDMKLPVCGACRRSTRGKLLSNVMDL